MDFTTDFEHVTVQYLRLILTDVRDLTEYISRVVKQLTTAKQRPAVKKKVPQRSPQQRRRR